MSDSGAQSAHPRDDEAGASSFRPEVRWHRVELIGFIILCVLPALALLGAFGPTLRDSHAEAGELRLDLRFPARMRFHTVEHLVVRVKNLGADPLTDVQLSFDSKYIQSFSDVLFTPGAGLSYLVTIEHLAPGQTSLTSVQLKADDYGLRTGDVSAAHDGGRVTLPVRTLILP